MSNRKLINLVGQRFGKLVVLAKGPCVKKHYYWKCQCDCGNVLLVSGSAIRHGASTSCGCNRILHSGSRKVTAELVSILRTEYKETDIPLKELADKYNLKYNTLAKIISRRSWANI